MTYRVIQWGTGAVGSCSLRQIIDHPELELAGVWVSGPGKAGKDAGELCGRDATGILATSSKQEIYDIDADIVIHNAIAVNADGALPFDDDVVQLLESGKNVISTASYFSRMIEGPERMARLEAACSKGNTTIYGGGVDPGFACDRVAALLSGSVTNVKHIRMIECQDVSKHPSFDLLSEVGFGKLPEERDMTTPGAQYYGGRLLIAAVPKLAELLGVQLDGIVPREELVLAEQDMETAMGTIKAGTIRGALHEFTGTRNGEPFITHQWITYMGSDGLPDNWLLVPVPEDDAPPYFVRVEIEGKPSLQMDLLYTDDEDVTSYSAPTAAVCVNAIPDVCEAESGFLQEDVFGRWRAKLK
tara:strand:- start:2210 stop:3283 length:1074 start_codon:yes stop_codon:yes gene_type:complete